VGQKVASKQGEVHWIPLFFLYPKTTVMKNLFTVFILGILLLAANPSHAQEMANRDVSVAFPQMKKFYGDMQRRVLDLPEIPDYYLLKVDFHMHTVFSDGYVWPVTRVEEAFMEGIDAISITDHVEFSPQKKYLLSDNHNLPYELAKPRADELGIILVRGAEVTREVPAGHFNAIFIEDANRLAKLVNKENPSDQSNIVETLQEVVNQGGFVFWNHPWYKQPNDVATWHPVHEELYKKGLIHGVEANNRDRYYPNVFQWCLDKGLAIMSTTDAHNPLFRLEPGTHRSMNVLLVKERSQKGIREALDNKRTVAYAQNYLYGKREHVEPIFSHSIVWKIIHQTDKGFIAELKNTSGLPFHLQITGTSGLKVQQSELIIEAHGNAALIFKHTEQVNGKTFPITVSVLNCHIGPEKPLDFVFNFKP
jgi:3',5'-nucleoside bisphosphate phosphatase